MKAQVQVQSVTKDTYKIPKPIVKWVGGKTQILDTVIGLFPTQIHNYRELFVGGGSILLALLTYVKKGIITITGSVYAYDVNEQLISLYKNIQTNHDDLYNKVQEFIQEYTSANGLDVNRDPSTFVEATMSKENYYYWMRKQYNGLSVAGKNSVLGSAMFVFLNKTCFRGIYREGPKGFNVPYGHYKNPEIINKDHLIEIHDLIKDVIFTSNDFDASSKEIVTGDFVYLDPPYAPETINSFVSYTKNGFDKDQHAKLFQLCDNLTDAHTKLLMNNSNVQIIKNHFLHVKYNIHTLICKRAINSKNPSAKTSEVIITNYSL
jgi:DNA adenine methylase